MLHFLCYIIKYGLGAYPSSRDDFTDDFQGWKAYQWIFPPAICFSWNGKDGGQLNATTNEILMDDEYNPLPPLGYSDCGSMLAGLYGTIAITFLRYHFGRREYETYAPVPLSSVLFQSHYLCPSLYLICQYALEFDLSILLAEFILLLCHPSTLFIATQSQNDQ